MIKAWFALAILLAGFSGCRKDDVEAAPYTGMYKGMIIDDGFNVAGNFTDTLKEYTITLTPSSVTPGDVFVQQGLIDSKEGKISRNLFAIPKKLVAKDEFFEVFEWAEGSFSGSANQEWTVTFYRETVNRGNAIARISRKGTLVKQ